MNSPRPSQVGYGVGIFKVERSGNLSQAAGEKKARTDIRAASVPSQTSLVLALSRRAAKSSHTWLKNKGNLLSNAAALLCYPFIIVCGEKRNVKIA